MSCVWPARLAGLLSADGLERVAFAVAEEIRSVPFGSERVRQSQQTAVLKDVSAVMQDSRTCRVSGAALHGGNTAHVIEHVCAGLCIKAEVCGWWKISFEDDRSR